MNVRSESLVIPKTAAQGQSATRVSVIIPMHNAAGTIEETLQSVLDTHTPGLEVIVSDDASTDAGVQIVEEFAARVKSVPIRICRNPEAMSSGAARTRNRGAVIAQGEYLAFLDADDIYLPHRFVGALRALDSDERLAAVFGTFRYEFVSESGVTSLREFTANAVAETENRIFDTKPLLTQLLNGNAGLHISSLTIRRQTFHELGGFPPIPFAEDNAFLLRLFSTRVVRRTADSPVSVYRIHPNSLCSKGHLTTPFLLGPLHDRIDTINWLSRHPQFREAKHEISRSLFHRVLFKYSQIRDQHPHAMPALVRTMVRSARMCPSFLGSRNFCSALLRGSTFILRRKFIGHPTYSTFRTDIGIQS